MKKILTILFLTAAVTGLFAQDFEVPENYVLNKPDDYAKYEKDIIRCFDWMMATPINDQAQKRKDASAFFIKWLTGSPDISVDIKQEIVNFMQPNPDLLVIFMGGWVKYAVETKDFNNKMNGNLKGVESVIAFYQKNKDNLQKDKNVEKYIKMKEKGTLNDYIKKNI